jgi:hypothetical protein
MTSENSTVSLEIAKKLYAANFEVDSKYSWCCDENALWAQELTEEAEDGIPGVECCIPAPSADELAFFILRRFGEIVLKDSYTHASNVNTGTSDVLALAKGE